MSESKKKDGFTFSGVSLTHVSDTASVRVNVEGHDPKTLGFTTQIRPWGR
jgi:hypothetical protein